MLALAFGLLCACNKTPTPTAEKPTPAPTESASEGSVAIPILSGERPAPEALPPPKHLVFEQFALKNTQPEALYPLEGALAVSEKLRIGRITGDGQDIEWIGQLPKKEGHGEYVVMGVQGRYPNAVDLTYATTEPRAPTPSYRPLTGKGTGLILAPGGSGAVITGLATAGDSTFLTGWSYAEGILLVQVRGPKGPHKRITPAEAGCKPGEIVYGEVFPVRPAVETVALGGTPAGTLISLGYLCQKRGLAAEVWDKEGKSRIVDLSLWIKSRDDSFYIISGPGDELWIHAHDADTLLRYKDGNFDVLALPASSPGQATDNIHPTDPKDTKKAPHTHKIHKIFKDTANELHLLSGQTIYRRAQDTWIPTAHLRWNAPFITLAFDEQQNLWASIGQAVYRARETQPLDFRDDCPTPFVFLYDVSPNNAPNFTFPSTQKALATFPGAEQIRLVEFNEYGRRLGVSVSDKEKAQHLIAHVQANMKDEHPMLLCYQPQNPRNIPLKAATPKP